MPSQRAKRQRAWSGDGSADLREAEKRVPRQRHAGSAADDHHEDQ